MSRFVKSPKLSIVRRFAMTRFSMFRSLGTVLLMTIAAISMNQTYAELAIHTKPSMQKIASSNKAVSSTNDFINQVNNTATPTDTSIVKLMQVMHIDEQIESIVNGQQAAIDVINTQTQKRIQQTDDSNSSELNKRQRDIQDQIQNILGQYAKIMTSTIGESTDTQKLTQAYITAAKTYYTQDEVDAQIEFYDTVIGQSLLAKQPLITAAFLKQSLPDDISDTEEQLSDLIPTMKQLINGVF